MAKQTVMVGLAIAKNVLQVCAPLSIHSIPRMVRDMRREDGCGFVAGDLASQLTGSVVVTCPLFPIK